MTTGNRKVARALANTAVAIGTPLAWFDALYQVAHQDGAVVPWADMQPNPHLVSWLGLADLSPGTALVVGCGYGDDAEWLAARGWNVTAFDISPTVIDACQRRFPDSAVTYETANLLSPPDEWDRYDLVFEAYTVQVLPPQSAERAAAIAALQALTRHHLLVVARGRASADDPGQMPWPLTEEEIHSFASGPLRQVDFEDFVDTEDPPVRRFRAVFQR